MTFESEGIEMITGKDGEGAINTLQHRPTIDGLLSDIMMSGMSGIELAGVARRLRPDLKIVLMTEKQPDRAGTKQRFSVTAEPFARSDIRAAFAQTSPPHVLMKTVG